MSTTKEEVIALISSLPDDCTMDDIHYHLYVREKVQRGIEDVDEGKTVSQEEIEQRIGQWRQSIGRTQP